VILKSAEGSAFAVPEAETAAKGCHFPADDRMMGIIRAPTQETAAVRSARGSDQRDEENAMKDGNLDAGSLSVGLGASALLDLASTRDMDLVCMTPDEVDKITADFPHYSPFTIPAGTYPGVDHDCATIQVANHLFVRADADPDLVYQMTKVLYENKDKLVQTSKAASTVSPAYAMQSTVVPLHPGAARYYEEASVEIPARILKDGADSVAMRGANAD